MKPHRIINNRITSALLIMVSVLLLSTSCDDDLDKGVYKTSNTQMIDEYMDDSDNQLDKFLAIIDKADFRGMLHAFGTYTVFTPTNDAVDNYFKSENAVAPSIEALTMLQAQEIIKLHTIVDTLSTQDFVDGRLPAASISRIFLTTRLTSVGSDVYHIVNRQARLMRGNIKLGNGYIHKIDNMLLPPNYTVGETLMQLPDEFSLFKEVVRRTKYNETLSRVNDSIRYTFFVQDNEAFESIGVNNMDDLIARLLDNTPTVTNPDTLLYNFVAYHSAPELKYVTDLLYTSTLTTSSNKQVITFKTRKDTILLNEFKLGQLDEAGVMLDKNSEFSDLTCSNGVIHKLNGQIEIKVRKPYPVFWDMGEQPEIQAQKGFRKNGTSVRFNPGELSEMQFGGKNSPSVLYYCQTTYNSSTHEYIYGDYLEFRVCTNVMQWVEFKTPLLIEGVYKVWICYRKTNNGSFTPTFKQDGFDNQVLPTTAQLNQWFAVSADDDQKNALGLKQYTANMNTRFLSVCLGTITVYSTGRHTLRWDAASGSAGSGICWDQIHYIPVDHDQQYPRIDFQGKLIEKGTRACEYFPYPVCPE